MIWSYLKRWGLPVLRLFNRALPVMVALGVVFLLIVNVLEVVSGCRQRHPGFSRHGPMAHTTYAVAHDNAHGGKWNGVQVPLSRRWRCCPNGGR